MSKRKTSIKNLPAVTREDGIIDIPENSMGLTTVEAEFDRAMKAQGEYERAHPVEAAVDALVHCWKHNRHTSSGCDYGWMLDLYSKKPIWEKVKPLVEARGLPVTKEAWDVVNANYTWKLRHQWICEGRGLKHYQKMPWYATYQMMVSMNHPALRGEWSLPL